MKSAMAIRSSSFGKLSCFLPLLLLLLVPESKQVETAILAPSDLTVDNGTEAAFICTIPCAHSFSWYIGDEKISKRRFNSLTWTSFKAKAGIALELENLSTCSTNGNDYVDSQRLTIVTTTELDGMPIQCAAGSLLESGPQSFSRYSILHVNAPPPITAEPPTSDPLPSPSSTASTSAAGCPTPLPTPSCPTPSPEVVRVTVTQVEVSTVFIQVPGTPGPEVARSGQSGSTNIGVRFHDWFYLLVLYLMSCVVPLLL